MLYLVSPNMDKGWSLQHFTRGEEIDKIRGYWEYMKSRTFWEKRSGYEYVEECRAFRQGFQNGWIMIEFWTFDQDAILKYAMEMASQINEDLKIVNIRELGDEYEKEAMGRS